MKDLVLLFFLLHDEGERSQNGAMHLDVSMNTILFKAKLTSSCLQADKEGPRPSHTSISGYQAWWDESTTFLSIVSQCPHLSIQNMHQNHQQIKFIPTVMLSRFT